ncbi:MAG TPA: hypothetical protein VJ806_13145 [Luteimonas sp.]|nr:hypothetical protein [Luteimonas sp.]
MKKLFIAALMLLLSVGGANAQDAGTRSDQLRIPAGQEARDGELDGDCEQTGSNIWICWACSETGDQTICDSWVETDDYEEVYRDPLDKPPVLTKP